MNNPMQIMQMYAQFKQNPRAVLGRMYQIPDDMTDPQQITQHLLNTGQIDQNAVNQAVKLSQNPFFSGLNR